MSFGQPEPSVALARAVAACLRRGMVLVAAAGNSHWGPVEVPARLPGVLAVGGVDRTGTALWSSARGPEVALAAPGGRILSLAPEGGMQVLSGTSMAAAHVAGTAALVLAARPDLDPAALRQVLVQSADPLPRAGRTAVGAGLVRADRALGLG